MTTQRKTNFVASAGNNPQFRTYFAQSIAWTRALPPSQNTSDLVRVVSDATMALPRFASLKVRSGVAEDEVVVRALQRAVAALRTLDAQRNAVDSVTDAAAMMPVVAYYAMYQALATNRVSAGGRLNDHAAGAAYFADLIANGLVPAPLDRFAVGASAATFRVEDSSGKTFIPKVAARNLFAPQNDADTRHRIGQALVTTRKEGRTPDYFGARRGGKPARHNTTVLDWVYRLRHRVQYDSADAFTVGAAADLDLRVFAQNMYDLAYAFATVMLCETNARMGGRAVESVPGLRDKSKDKNLSTPLRTLLAELAARQRN